MITHPPDDLLIAFARGRAAPAELHEIETHLGGCQACCTRVEDSYVEDSFVVRLRIAAESWTPTRITQATVTSPPIVIGSYRVERELGRGGMGTVYLAHDDRLHRAVAVKTMRPEVAARPGAGARFIQEARSAAQVEHDHVVPIWQVGEDAGTPFIAMPYLQGESLSQRLKREPVAPIELVLQVGREIAEGLAAAHDRGLIHRDIKPGNIWLEGTAFGHVRRCKILDFGLASWQASDNGKLTGLTVGSPGFMAPEQARGQAVDPRSDLFGLGAVLYRMVTGKMPWEGGNDSTLTSEAKLISSTCPPRLAELIQKMLAEDPTKRPASASEVATAIRIVAQTRSARPSQRARLAVAGLVAALVVAAVVIKIRQPDGKETTLTVPGGSAVRIDANGDAVVELPMNNIDRQAAEWVLGRGGRVTIRSNGTETALTVPQRVPASPFTVVTVDLSRCAGVTPDGLAQLRGLRDLVSLNLEGAGVTDAGLVHLSEMNALRFLNLALCPEVTDTGIGHLRVLAHLGTLNLHGTALSDDGLKPIGNLSRLTVLNLSNTRITDPGLARLKGLFHLAELHLANTKVTETGLAHLIELPNLARLYLHEGAATDEGLKTVARLPRLIDLGLINCPKVTDAGLAHLKRLTNLSALNLQGTGVTGAGLPHLALLTKLEFLSLSEANVTDDDLAHLKALKNLRELHLVRTRITGPGLAHLVECQRLSHLQMGATPVNDEGLKHVALLKHLNSLSLAGTGVTDNGLVHLNGLTKLTALVLNATKVTDAGLTTLGKMGSLTFLDLDRTAVTGRGIPALAKLSGLRELRLNETRLTPAEVESLRGLLPECRISAAITSR